MSRRLLATLALLAVLPTRAGAQVVPLPGVYETPGVVGAAQPLQLFGSESAAYVEGVHGAFLNPAALGVRYPAELFGSWSRFDDVPQDAVREAALGGRMAGPGRGPDASRWGLGLGSFSFHGGHVEDVSRTIGIGLASGGERFRWGHAVEWLADADGGGTVTDHRFGVLARPASWLALGAVADHLGQPTFRGARLERAWTAAAALRPFALGYGAPGGWGTRVTLTFDAVMDESGTWDRARKRLGGEIEMLPGVLVRGSLEDRDGFHLGLTLRGVNATLGGQRGESDLVPRHETYAMSVHAGEERSVLAGPARRRVAAIRAGGALGDDALSGLSLFGPTDVTPARPLHDQLERALEDPLTRGVLLDLRGVGNMAQLEELRPRIARLRAAGKPVVAFLEYGAGRGDLYLAAACDRVVMTPEANSYGLGLRVERRSYRGLLERWGIRVDRSSWGRYKSAYRSFSVDSVSAADREAIERGLDVSQDLLVSALAADRRVARERVLAALDGRPWDAADLRGLGLVDSVGYREDALRTLGALAGLGAEPRAVSLGRLPEAKRDWTLPAPVAVVYASGSIVTGKGGGDLLMGPAMGSETVVSQVERAFKRPGVKAVVLRVESGGGSALASDLIHHATVRMKRETEKPLVVSMGGVAASGGYYIAAAADRIYADRFTRTGSIGVVTVKPSLEGWYAKHGVRQEDFERGPYMGMWSTNRDLTPAQQAAADSATLRFYHRFVSRVADGRHMSHAAVDSVAQGRVWMGEDARARGLVDRIGTLEDAVADARQRAGVPPGAKIRLVEYRRPRGGLLQRVLGQAMATMWREAVRMPDPGAPLLWDDGDDAE